MTIDEILRKLVYSNLGSIDVEKINAIYPHKCRNTLDISMRTLYQLHVDNMIHILYGAPIGTSSYHKILV
jgi:hypothetical protein